MATYQTAGYPAHPQYFAYDYRSSPQTPPQQRGDGYNYYSPRQHSYATPPKGHARRPTVDATFSYSKTTYPTPRQAAYYPSPDYSSAKYYNTSAKSTPQRKSDYVPVYSRADPTNESSGARPRRASYTTYGAKPTYTSSTPRRPSTATKSPPKATAEDARQAGIPAGFCYKNWDPTEEPILLLGSVFDANSLGKWIYDWTVFFFGPATPMTDVAGDLWLLLIQLAGKVKRAEECLGRIRRTASRELVDDFLESGERLWQRFNKLLKTCEAYMWKAARKESGGRSDAKVRMGKNSGCEFVDAIFGRDRELEHTEQLMTGMRLWSMRFDANCENILRDPSA